MSFCGKSCFKFDNDTTLSSCWIVRLDTALAHNVCVEIEYHTFDFWGISYYNEVTIKTTIDGKWHGILQQRA